MPNISQMKTLLYSKYPSKRWKKRIDGMSDSQIIAIWYSPFKNMSTFKSHPYQRFYGS